MPALDLKSQLGNLIQLQGLDTQIYGLKQEKEAKPAEIKVLEEEFEAKKQHLAELEKKLLDVQKQRKDKELELASKEESVKKLQGQLYQLKTNKEYQMMLQQIGDTKADGSVIEDKILELFNEADTVKAEVDAEKQKLVDEEKAFKDKKSKVEARVKEIEGQIAELEAKRGQILPLIDHKIMAQYERILASRDGLAIVSVKHNSCQGCNMFVPAQVINLIRMYENIITCEVCNRMLYIEDEAS